MTLTGRTDLWKDLLALSASPVFGAGYDSFWLGDRLEKLWEKYWWLPNEAHNGYLEVYLNVGLIGLLLLAGILISTYKKIQKTLMVDSDYGRFKMAFFIMILSYNITEAAFRGMAFMWLMFLLIAVENPPPSALPVPGLFGTKPELSSR
jgi:O-antigen ligase